MKDIIELKGMGRIRKEKRRRDEISAWRI